MAGQAGIDLAAADALLAPAIARARQRVIEFLTNQLVEFATGGRMRITGPVDASTVSALMKALAKSKRRR